jgi:hypothetical protein
MSLLDAAGHLSPDGIAAVGDATPGGIPPEVAAHLASCSRCQERVLSEGIVRGPRKPTKAPPSIKRALVLVVLILASIVVFFWTLRQLTG